MPTTHPHRTLIRSLLAATALALVALVSMIATTPAGAHGGEGQVDVTSLTRDGDNVTVTVHVIYIADGHGVPEATVTLVVDGGTPVPMGPGAADGDYTATVPAPSGAAMRITSVEPAVTVEATAPETPPTTTEAPTSTTTTASTDTSDPATTEDTPAVDEAAAAGPSDPDASSDDGTSAVLVGGLIALVVIVGAAVAFIVLRKPSPDQAP